MKTEKQKPETLEAIVADLIRESELNYRGVFKSVEFDIEISNEYGDANVEHTVELINSGTEKIGSYRTILLSDAPIEDDEAMGFAARSDGKSLRWEISPSTPNEKHVVIKFHPALRFMDSRLLKFEYTWPGMFSEEEEYYAWYVARPCWKVGFTLRYCKGYEVRSFDIAKYSRIHGKN